MVKKEVIIIADYTNTEPLTLDEFCEACSISNDFIQALIEHDIVHPIGEQPNQWQFELEEVQRVKTAQRLQRDLEVNMAGIALVLDLLDELDELRAHAQLIERHYTRHR